VSHEFSDSLDAIRLRGLAAYEARDWMEAVKEYQRAREIEPWCMDGMVCFKFCVNAIGLVFRCVVAFEEDCRTKVSWKCVARL
jgi:hypothetical protein